ncbi:DUF4241 domain-containing protein [Actinomadura fulvescens]|uniref:DUF4241 domain-containing protein n=1 Tax=Actinomadura fulvescens TaxID=46160 RepID=A0ABN3QZZ6_9ACTN
MRIMEGERLGRRTLLTYGAFATAAAALGGFTFLRRSGDPDSRGGLAEPTDDPVEVVYGAGWNVAARSLDHPVSEALARTRDAAGEQYAVLLIVGGVPRMVIEVCWRAHHAELWNLDGSGRKYRGVSYRRWPDGRLRLFEVRSWSPGSSGGEPNFRGRIRRAVAGPVRDVETWTRTNGGVRQTYVNWSEWPERARPPDNAPVPSPGDWPRFAGLTGSVTVRPGSATAPTRFPWRAPQPLRPSHLTELTTPGTRFVAENGRKVTVERVSAGRLRLPSGRLAVQDPGWSVAEPEPLLATVPAGEYPVDLFRFAGVGAPHACRVRVTGKPVRSWHLALRAGEHELFLGDGELYGAGVDTGTLALADATGWPHYKQNDVEQATADDKALFTSLDDPRPGSPTNMIVMPTYWGDGSYPVWLGRAADGEISCYLVDYLPRARPSSSGLRARNKVP